MRVYEPSFGGVINVDATPLSEDPDTQVAQVIDMMVGLRVKRDVEVEGLDINLHGETVHA